MQISILLLKQIVQLFLMILMGYIMVKIKFLKEEDSKVISKIILYLIIPAVIIHGISGRLYLKHYERTGSCMYRICDPAVFITVCHMDHGKNVSFKHGGIHICLLFQLRKPDRTISHLYLRKRMGHLRLCLHECSIILHLDPLQM